MSRRPVELLAIEDDVYEEWKRHGQHYKEYICELIETLFSVFCVVGAVCLFFSSNSPIPAVIPSDPLRLLLLGLLLGAVSWLVAASPPGKLSGAHTNPAVSLGFVLLGKMHPRDLWGYWAGQTIGAGMGGLLGAAVFGLLARQVRDGSLHPGPSVDPTAVFFGEIGATFALTYVVFTFVSHHKLAHWTPAAAMVMVGFLVWLDGNYSGAGMNPARWFGPALSLPIWHLWWAYLFGPLLGASFAVLLRRTGWVFPAMPHTGKLMHDARYRSIFKHDTLPSAPP